MASRQFSIANVAPSETHNSYARRAKDRYEYQAVKPQLVDEEIESGWQVSRKNRSSVRMMREKPLPKLFEDRVWSLMYSMGFPSLSGKGGAVLTNDSSGVTSQLDVVAFDSDIIVFIECRTSQQARKAPKFNEDAAKLSAERDDLANAIATLQPTTGKRRVAPIFWGYNVAITEQDRDRASDYQVRYLNQEDLNYYEQLVKRIGPAARFQFLADVFRDQEIPNLTLIVPAIRMSLGGKNASFTFSISPEQLLKIAYVSHRWRTSSHEDPGYQRFMSKGRLDQIRRFIQDGNYFPTNIVVNLQGQKVRFEKTASQRESASGDYGWLHLPTAYRSAWIIDGQHRLFAYAGLKQARTAHVTVVAFENLNKVEQLNLFVQINSKQKKVPQNLLTSLYGDLRWDSQDAEEQASAIVSRLMLKLTSEPGSPFLGRISNGEDEKDDRKCITLTTLAKAFDHSDFFVRNGKGGAIPGALWTDHREATLKRAYDVFTAWYSVVADLNQSVWDLGKAPGGGLAMNNGCTVVANVLKAVIVHLNAARPTNLLTTKELNSKLEPFAQTLGKYFSAMNEADWMDFRALQGSAGQTTGTREALIFLARAVAGFEPPGIREVLDARAERTSEKALEILSDVIRLLRDTVVVELKNEFGPSEEGWFFTGVPKKICIRIDRERIEDSSKGVVRSREDRITLADIKDIAKANWELFGDIMGDGPKNASRDQQLRWLARFDQIYTTASSPKLGPVRIEDLDYVRKESERLKERVATA